jgi:hypothetical protein
MRAQLLRTFALATAILAAMTGLATAQRATVVRSGNLVLAMNGGVSPKRLPRHKLAPIALSLYGGISTVDGSQPPVAKTVRIDFDRHGTIDAKGLPRCKPAKLQARDTARAKAACRSAIVGKGTTSVRVSFPEQTPFTATGPLVLFNGGVRHGVTTMLIHAYVDVPTPTAIVTVVKIRRIHKGPYGTRATARIPTIAGGSGALTRFGMVVHRIFRSRGHKRSYLEAECANGRFLAHGTVSFADGSRISGDVVRRCRQARRRSTA